MKEYKNSGYYITKKGEVISKKQKKNRTLYHTTSTNGYKAVVLYLNGKRSFKLVHRLVAEVFLKSFNDTLQVNHINTLKNDNNLNNLELVTCEENIKHHIQSIGGSIYHIKITDKFGIETIVKTYKEVADVIGCKRSSVSKKLLNGEVKNRNGYTFEKIINQSYKWY